MLPVPVAQALFVADSIPWYGQTARPCVLPYSSAETVAHFELSSLVYKNACSSFTFTQSLFLPSGNFNMFVLFLKDKVQLISILFFCLKVLLMNAELLGELV